MDPVFWLKALGLFSVFAFFATLVAVPLIIARLRDDFFVNRTQHKQARRVQHPLLSPLVFFLRNSMGCIFVAMGILMLFLPGQGLLTIIIGLCFMDFPGKDSLLQRLVQIPRIQQVLNWIRKKQGKTNFIFQADTDNNHQ